MQGTRNCKNSPDKLRDLRRKKSKRGSISSISAVWDHNWYEPTINDVAAHEVVRGPFPIPLLVASEPYVIFGLKRGKCRKYETDPGKRQEDSLINKRAATLRTGIPDPWIEYLIFRAIPKISRNIDPNDLNLWADHTNLAETVWRKLEIPLEQGIPDPWINWPRRVGYRKTKKQDSRKKIKTPFYKCDETDFRDTICPDAKNQSEQILPTESQENHHSLINLQDKPAFQSQSESYHSKTKTRYHSFVTSKEGCKTRELDNCRTTEQTEGNKSKKLHRKNCISHNYVPYFGVNTSSREKTSRNLSFYDTVICNLCKISHIDNNQYSNSKICGRHKIFENNRHLFIPVRDKICQPSALKMYCCRSHDIVAENGYKQTCAKRFSRVKPKHATFESTVQKSCPQERELEICTCSPYAHYSECNLNKSIPGLSRTQCCKCCLCSNAIQTVSPCSPNETSSDVLPLKYETEKAAFECFQPEEPKCYPCTSWKETLPNRSPKRLTSKCSLKRVTDYSKIQRTNCCSCKHNLPSCSLDEPTHVTTCPRRINCNFPKTCICQCIHANQCDEISGNMCSVLKEQYKTCFPSVQPCNSRPKVGCHSCFYGDTICAYKNLNAGCPTNQNYFCSPKEVPTISCKKGRPIVKCFQKKRRLFHVPARKRGCSYKSRTCNPNAFVPLQCNPYCYLHNTPIPNEKNCNYGPPCQNYPHNFKVIYVPMVENFKARDLPESKSHCIVQSLCSLQPSCFHNSCEAQRMSCLPKSQCPPRLSSPQHSIALSCSPCNPSLHCHFAPQSSLKSNPDSYVIRPSFNTSRTTASTSCSPTKHITCGRSLARNSATNFPTSIPECTYNLNSQSRQITTHSCCCLQLTSSFSGKNPNICHCSILESDSSSCQLDSKHSECFYCNPGHRKYNERKAASEKVTRCIKDEHHQKRAPQYRNSNIPAQRCSCSGTRYISWRDEIKNNMVCSEKNTRKNKKFSDICDEEVEKAEKEIKTISADFLKTQGILNFDYQAYCSEDKMKSDSSGLKAATTLPALIEVSESSHSRTKDICSHYPFKTQGTQYEKNKNTTSSSSNICHSDKKKIITSIKPSTDSGERADKSHSVSMTRLHDPVISLTYLNSLRDKFEFKTKDRPKREKKKRRRDSILQYRNARLAGGHSSPTSTTKIKLLPVREGMVSKLKGISSQQINTKAKLRSKSGHRESEYISEPAHDINIQDLLTPDLKLKKVSQKKLHTEERRRNARRRKKVPSNSGEISPCNIYNNTNGTKKNCPNESDMNCEPLKYPKYQCDLTFVELEKSENENKNEIKNDVKIELSGTSDIYNVKDYPVHLEDENSIKCSKLLSVDFESLHDYVYSGDNLKQMHEKATNKYISHCETANGDVQCSPLKAIEVDEQNHFINAQDSAYFIIKKSESKLKPGLFNTEGGFPKELNYSKENVSIEADLFSSGLHEEGSHTSEIYLKSDKDALIKKSDTGNNFNFWSNFQIKTERTDVGENKQNDSALKQSNNNKCRINNSTKSDSELCGKFEDYNSYDSLLNNSTIEDSTDFLLKGNSLSNKERTDKKKSIAQISKSKSESNIDKQCITTFNSSLQHKFEEPSPKNNQSCKSTENIEDIESNILQRNSVTPSDNDLKQSSYPNPRDYRYINDSHRNKLFKIISKNVNMESTINLQVKLSQDIFDSSQPCVTRDFQYSSAEDSAFHIDEFEDTSDDNRLSSPPDNGSELSVTSCFNGNGINSKLRNTNESDLVGNYFKTTRKTVPDEVFKKIVENGLYRANKHRIKLMYSGILPLRPTEVNYINRTNS